MKYYILIFLIFLPYQQAFAEDSDALDEVTIKVIGIDDVRFDQAEIIGLPSISELGINEPISGESNTEISGADEDNPVITETPE